MKHIYVWANMSRREIAECHHPSHAAQHAKKRGRTSSDERRASHRPMQPLFQMAATIDFMISEAYKICYIV